MSPSISVDEAWNRLLLYPGVYQVACCRAHEMATRVVGGGTGDDSPSSYTYADDYPGLVDHSPSAANNPVPTKEQRRRAAAREMNCLGLIPSTSSAPSAPRSGQSCAIAITLEAPRNVRARLTDGRTGESVIQIFVIGINGRRTNYRVNPLMLFEDFAHQFAERMPINHNELQFIYQGRQLVECQHTFAAYGISHMITIHVIPRLHGC